MNQTAFCPSCKRDVVFDVTDGASYCPACGARFELPAVPTQRTRFRWFDPLIFLAWMFLPAIAALIILHQFSTPKPPHWDRFLRDHGAVVIVWMVLAGLSSIGASAWLTGRFTRRLWLKILVGILFGLGIFICNAVIAFFGSCAMMPVPM